MQKDRQPHTLVHHRVYVIPDPVPAPKPPVPADTSYIEYIFRSYDLVDIQALDSTILVKLQYADTANFLKANFYDGLRHAYFPCEVALKLCNAQASLKRVNPALSLCILDATRPLHIQQLMWDSLKLPPDRKYNYLSPPYEISLHNYGCAVDVTVFDNSQNMLMDMGSGFDCFEPVSQPALEWKFLKSGALSAQAVQNRRLLRYVMKQAGFHSIASEWWHFGYCSKERAAAKFKLIK